MVGEGKRVESLGWLTESSVMPKKHKAIEGVGASSIVELKAQLYRTQEETRKSKDSDTEFLRAKKKPLSNDLFSHKNSGVDARAHRVDKMELKAVNDGSTSYAALERKAELYDKLARGELPDEEEKEKYCVDFFQKSLVQDQPQQSESDNTSNIMPQVNKESDADDLLPNSRSLESDQTNTKLDHEEHKRFVREVHEEATQEREKATSIKLRRQEQLAARREKLRQAYLRKQLEKLTSKN
ncbi:hypothetical protein DsansV1_C42g0239631 [Dioscorea sansibarensis]